MQKDGEIEIEVLGFWWIIGYPNKRYPGLLRFSKKDGATLQIFHNESFDKLMNWNERYEIIHGIAENKVFTLYDCTQISFLTSNLNYQTFDSKYLFSHNTHYLEDKDDVQFSRII